MTTDFVLVYVVGRDEPIETEGKTWFVDSEGILYIYGPGGGGPIATFAADKWISIERGDEILDGPYSLTGPVTLVGPEGTVEASNTDVYLVLNKEATFS